MPFVFFMLLLYSAFCTAQPPVGRVINSTANSSVINRGEQQITARQRADVAIGDIIQTRADESLLMRMLDSAQITLLCESRFEIKLYPRSQRLTAVELQLHRGNLRMIGGNVNAEQFSLITAVGVLQQERATFEIIQESPSVLLFGVFAGAIRLSSPQGEVVQDAASEPRFISYPQNGMPDILTREEYTSRRDAACTLAARRR